MRIPRICGLALISLLVLSLAIITASCVATPSTSPEVPAAATPGGPAISVEPTSGPVGSHIVVKGRNWEKGDSVVISVARVNSDAAGAFGDTVIKDDGSFETSFNLPAWPKPGDQLLLVAHTSDYSLKAMAPFQVTK